jgi:signal transduction histidine kinase
MSVHSTWAAVERWVKENATTVRLGLSYLAIIMVLSIGFSIIFYNTSIHELGRELPPRDLGRLSSMPTLDSFIRQRIAQGKHALFEKLLVLNVGALVFGAAVSYVLARQALEPIEEAVEAQSRFASDASHELRTPLAVIQAENEVALRSKDLTLARAKELLASNLEEAVKLKGLSEGLLRLAQKSRSDTTLEPVSLADVATEATNHVLKLAQKKGITIEDKVPKIMVNAEMGHLTQAIVVFLDNAIKYSYEKSTIYITAEVKGRAGYIHVRDEGVGIPADILPHIFDRFYRADVARSKQDGSGYGLGLSLARTIVQQLDGEVIVRSTPGKGSIFTIKLPVVVKRSNARKS